jgi:hypothetical protein
MKKQTGAIMYSILATLKNQPEITVIAVHNLNGLEVRSYLNNEMAKKQALKDGDTDNLLWDVFYTKDVQK